MGLGVLIVDDDLVFASLLEIRLVKSGLSANPVIFPDCETALEFLDGHVKGENFLIILDINFKFMSGWQMLEQIQDMSLYNRVLVLIVTASINTSDHQKAKEYPQVIDFLEKPLKFDTFERIMRLPHVARLLSPLN